MFTYLPQFYKYKVCSKGVEASSRSLIYLYSYQYQQVGDNVDGIGIGTGPPFVFILGALWQILINVLMQHVLPHAKYQYAPCIKVLVARTVLSHT
jgi:hypothetical protein